jgi:DnaJ-class molecular chaperone
MKKNKQVTIIDKSDTTTCWKCEGQGVVFEEGNNPPANCSLCQGSGKYRESHYIIVDEKNKIAIDSDSEGK